MEEHFRQNCRSARYTMRVYDIFYFDFTFSLSVIFIACIIFNCIITLRGLPLSRTDNTVPSSWRTFSDNNISIIRRQRQQQNVVVPPHCSKAIVTASQSSRLTRRSTASSSQQMSLNIGVAQTICFCVDDVKSSNDRSDEREEERFSKTSSVPENINSAGADRRRIVRPIIKNYAALRASGPSNSNANNSSTSMESSKNSGERNSGENRTTRKASKAEATTRGSGKNLLHTVTVVELEQYYAITERYRFAIPELETNCICECNPLATTCQADEWLYGECAPMSASGGGQAPGTPTACHRTYFPNQPSGSCSSADTSTKSARLCCQLRFRAYQNRVFTALRLEPTISHATLQYSVFEYQSQQPGNGSNDAARWLERNKRRISVQLDGMIHNSVLDSDVGLTLSILGLGGNSASVQLETGMYYVENLQDGEFSEIHSQPLNRITEHDFHKLGWLRVAESASGWNAGAAFVQSGDIFLDKIHHAKTNDCSKQQFRSVLDASYYLNRDEQMNNSTTEFRLVEPLNVAHSWIRSARVLKTSSLRQAVVRAGEGVNLDVTLTLPPPSDAEADNDADGPSRHHHHPTIAFVHNSSRIVDFTGVIFVDRYSNSFLNLSLYGARGVLNGYVHQMADWDGENIDTFSFTVPQHQLQQQQQGPQQEDVTTVVERIKPYPVNSIQVVCLRPDDADLAAELCRPVQSVELELEVNTVRNEWSYRIGSCAECNKISVEGFMKYLNPLNWTKGITSVGDALMLASDVVLYAFALVALYFIVAKILIPLAYCCICPMHAFYSHSKSLAAYALSIRTSNQNKKKTGSERSRTKLTTAAAPTPSAPRLTPKIRPKRVKR